MAPDRDIRPTTDVDSPQRVQRNVPGSGWVARVRRVIRGRRARHGTC
jgi:hypothetical protein